MIAFVPRGLRLTLFLMNMPTSLPSDRCVCAGEKVDSIKFDYTRGLFEVFADSTDPFLAKQVIPTTSVGVLFQEIDGRRKGKDFGMTTQMISAMERLYFSPDPSTSPRYQNEYMPLYYTVGFQFGADLMKWDVDYAL